MSTLSDHLGRSLSHAKYKNILWRYLLMLFCGERSQSLSQCVLGVIRIDAPCRQTLEYETNFRHSPQSTSCSKGFHPAWQPAIHVSRLQVCFFVLSSILLLGDRSIESPSQPQGPVSIIPFYIRVAAASSSTIIIKDPSLHNLSLPHSISLLLIRTTLILPPGNTSYNQRSQ